MITHISTIAAVNTVIGILPIILFLIFGFGGYWVIKHRKYSAALLAVSSVGGVISFIWGVTLVSDNNHDDRLTGAVMMAAGLVVVALIGIAIRGQNSTNKES